MVVLKKIRASTLVETIVASVIIVLVFGMASMILNNIFKTTITQDVSFEQYHLNKCIYEFKNGVDKKEKTEAFDNFDITVSKEHNVWLFQVIEAKTGKRILFKTLNP